MTQQYYYKAFTSDKTFVDNHRPLTIIMDEITSWDTIEKLQADQAFVAMLQARQVVDNKVWIHAKGMQRIRKLSGKHQGVKKKSRRISVITLAAHIAAMEIRFEQRAAALVAAKLNPRKTDCEYRWNATP